MFCKINLDQTTEILINNLHCKALIVHGFLEMLVADDKCDQTPVHVQIC